MYKLYIADNKHNSHEDTIYSIIHIKCFFNCRTKKKTYFDKATTIEVTSGTDSINAMLDDYERIQLPPLSVFLESVYDHPSVRIYEAKRDEANADMKITKREWFGLFQGIRPISIWAISSTFYKRNHRRSFISHQYRQ